MGNLREISRVVNGGVISRIIAWHAEIIEIIMGEVAILPSLEASKYIYIFVLRLLTYQEIIGQYMDIKERGITKKGIYYTEPGFAAMFWAIALITIASTADQTARERSSSLVR